jgi:beta-glucosidase
MSALLQSTLTPPKGRLTASIPAFHNADDVFSWDRMGLHDDYSDSIILNVANKCANTVVVIQNAGIRLVDTFYNHPNITAIIYAHLAGQDAGRSLTSLVYGDVSFSGKLPYSKSIPHSLCFLF